MEGKYGYRVRPGHSSLNLILEFVRGVEDDNFQADLFDAIQEISPKVSGLEDMWLNDEVLYTIDSNLGRFSLSTDIWNFAFILADDNQTCIAKIIDLLAKNDRFEKIAINPE